MTLTLGLGEFILLNSGLDSLVELRVKDTLGSDVDLVVSLNILLDSLTTAIGKIQSVTCSMIKSASISVADPRGISDGENRRNVPATISFLQLHAKIPVSNENQ